MENRLGIGCPLPMIKNNSAHTQQDLFNNSNIINNYYISHELLYSFNINIIRQT